MTVTHEKYPPYWVSSKEGTYQIANIFHRLQFLLSGGRLQALRRSLAACCTPLVGNPDWHSNPRPAFWDKENLCWSCPARPCGFPQRLPCFHNVRNPILQISDRATDGIHHTVSGFNISVEIGNVGLFQHRNGSSHMDGGKNIKPLPLIRTHIHSFGTSLGRVK